MTFRFDGSGTECHLNKFRILDELAASMDDSERAVWVGIYIGVVSLAVGYIYFEMDIDHWQIMMFTTLALLQVFQAMGSRSSTESFFKKSFTSNKTMLWIVSLIIALQMIALYTPLSEFLDLDSLNLRNLSVAFGLSFSLILALEVE